MSLIIPKFTQEQIKPFVISFLKKNRFIDQENNLYLAEKAFKAYYIAIWACEKYKENRLSASKFEKILKFLQKFKENKIELELKNDLLSIKKL